MANLKENMYWMYNCLVCQDDLTGAGVAKWVDIFLLGFGMCS